MPVLHEQYQHVLNEIRRRLNDPRGSKAAVMVGAGFSMNAVPTRSGIQTFPDWSALTAKLVDGLYPDESEKQRVLKRVGATSSALRLAEEFEAAFSRTTLIEFVRDALPEDDFRPGPAHQALLKLNWADVFTTNFDQLLERTPQALLESEFRTRSYSVVKSPADLPLARRPRIVKLHGTLPELSRMTLTEEDFRTYPVSNAAFVNAVCTSLTENTFCLVGFSGDDPNFLAWSGWVRDVMGSSMPRIYLFCGSEPEPFQRKLLENRGVIPVPLLTGNRSMSYSEALVELCTEFGKATHSPMASWNEIPNSSVWTTAREQPRDENNAAANPRNAIAVWRKSREAYTGWYILHRNGIRGLWHTVRFDRIDFASLAELDVVDQVEFWFELTWRYARCLHPLPDNLVEKHILPLLKVSQLTDDSAANWNQFSSAQRQMYMSLQCEVLRHARETGNTERFLSIQSELQKVLTSPPHWLNSDVQHFVHHQTLLWMIGTFHHSDEIRDELKSWNTQNADEIWTIRRIGLLLEYGLTDAAASELQYLFPRVTTARDDLELDIVSRSAEGLTSVVAALAVQSNEANSVEPSDDDSGASVPVLKLDPFELNRRREQLQNLGCDPGEVFDWLSLQVKHDADRGTSTPASIEYTTKAYQLIRLVEDAGLPLKTEQIVTVFYAEEAYQNAARIIGRASLSEGLGLVLRTRNEKAAREFLTPENVIALSTKQIESTAQSGLKCFKEAWQCMGPRPPRRQPDDERLRRQLSFAATILKMVVPRVPSSLLESIAEAVIDVVVTPEFWARFEARDEILGLATSILRCVPHSTHLSWLKPLLSSPVAGSQELPMDVLKTRGWTDLIDHLDLVHGDLDDLAPEIDKLVDRLHSATEKERAHLTQRMLKLRTAGLSESQKLNLRNALFSSVDDQGLPADTECLDWIILTLPEPRKGEFHKLLRTLIRSQTTQTWTFWVSLAEASHRFRTGRDVQRIEWTKRDRDMLLNQMSMGVPALLNGMHKLESQDKSVGRSAWKFFLSPSSEELTRMTRGILEVLEDAILLDPQSTNRQLERGHCILRDLEDGGITTTRLAPTLIILGKMDEPEAMQQVSVKLDATDSSEVFQGALAICRWCELCEASKLPNQPLTALLTRMATLAGSGRHQSSVLLTNTLVNAVDILGTSIPKPALQAMQLALVTLKLNTDYTLTDSPLSVATRVSLRRSCVKLALALAKTKPTHPVVQEWIDLAKDDMFADVRMAALTGQR